MNNKLLKVLGIAFFALLFVVSNSCKKDDDDNTSSDPVNPGPVPQGYKLTKHLIHSELPCFVNLMFQVNDMNDKGVPDLVTEDFEVLEDDQAVSPTESAMAIKKRNAISYKLKTVLMLDNSASVGSNLESIKTAAISLVNNIVDQQEICVYVFSEEPVLLIDFTDNVNELTDAINTISLGYATTNLYGSIITGASRWDDNYSTGEIEQGFLIVITDGSDTQGSSTIGSAMSAIGSKRVYTIGLGEEQDPEALTQLGTAGYFSLNDYAQLTAKFAEIQEEMNDFANSFYWLYYMSPKRGDNTHSLMLRVKNNLNTGSSSYISSSFNSQGFYSVLPGVVINDGIEELSLQEGESFYLHATTYLGDNTPSYVWASDDNSLLQVTTNTSDNAWALITAGLTAGGNTLNIRVTDIANDFEFYLPVSITHGPSPDADFNVSTNYCFVGETVYFTDLSTNEPTAWTWSFGDGNTSSQQHPEHQYSEVGTYTVQLTASNQYGFDNEQKTGIIVVESSPYQSFTDSRDGKQYRMIQIGSQTWMADNLDYDGVSHYVYSNNDSIAAIYGRLYNFESALNACPDGWHLPSKTEWETLVNYLGGEGVSGGKLKEAGTLHWLSPNTGATNESAFDAIPAGYRGFDSFGWLGQMAFYWTATSDNSFFSHGISLSHDKASTYQGITRRVYGQSVRCVKD